MFPFRTTPLTVCGGAYSPSHCRGGKFRRFRSIILGKSMSNEPSPQRSVLDPKDGRITGAIGGISKLVDGAHVPT